MTGFSNRNFCVPFAPFETRWIFHVNGKQPMFRLPNTARLERKTTRKNVCAELLLTNGNNVPNFLTTFYLILLKVVFLTLSSDEQTSISSNEMRLMRVPKQDSYLRRLFQ